MGTWTTISILGEKKHYSFKAQKPSEAHTIWSIGLCTCAPFCALIYACLNSSHNQLQSTLSPQTPCNHNTDTPMIRTAAKSPARKNTEV